jgi:hypothetical protein
MFEGEKHQYKAPVSYLINKMKVFIIFNAYDNKMLSLATYAGKSSHG